jgi:hypothetical protein
MNIEELKQRLAKVDDSLRRVEILPPGPYSFRLEEALFKKDEERKYAYFYVQLHCSGEAGEFKTSDGFPIVDELIWKFAQFCEAIGFSVDDLSKKRNSSDGRGSWSPSRKGTKPITSIRSRLYNSWFNLANRGKAVRLRSAKVF